MFKITIDPKSKTEMRALTDWVGKFEATVNDPKTMSVVAKPIGVEMDRVFTTEGSAGSGRWRGLSAQTQVLRVQRGYRPDHPILQQSGQLRTTTAGSLRRWGVNTLSMAAGGSGVGFAGSAGSRMFVAAAAGEKVQNNSGGTMSGGVSLPARQFFGMTPDAIEKAKQELVKKIMSDWGKKSSLVRRI